MPHEQIREENRKRVLETAIQLFSENGIEETSLADIAKGAAVSLRSVFRYYQTKDDLIRAVVDTSVSDLWEELCSVRNQSFFQELDGAHKIIEMVRTMLNYAKDNCKLQSKLVAAEHSLYKLGVTNIFSLSESKDNIITMRFVEIFREGVADGSIRPDIVGERRKFYALAVTYRGFFNRIAAICVNEKMASDYKPDLLIEDFSMAIYELIAADKHK